MPEPGQFGKAEASISTDFGGGNSAAEAFRSSEAQKMGGVSTFTSPGGKLNQAQFNQATGRTATNPYGYAAPTAIGQFFANTFGPENLDYSGITPGGTQGIATLNALALDVFNNPMAETNILGQATGANPELGIARSGVQPGQYTSMGTAKSYRSDLSPMGRVAAGLASLFGPLGSGYLVSEGTKVTGIEDTVPISARTGEPLSEAGTGAFSFLGDIMTGGQSQFVSGKASNMVDNMMNFFSGEQQPADIQSTDVAPEMSAYTEAGRPASGVPQLGPNYGSPMAQITAPATEAPSYGSPMAQITAPSASSEVTVAPGEAAAPVSNLTLKDTYFRPAFSEQTLKDAALANIASSQLEQSVAKGNISSNAQAGVMNELARRAALGDVTAQMAIDTLTPNY